MANFCSQCGRPLAEGEVCSCQKQGMAEETAFRGDGMRQGEQPHTQNQYEAGYASSFNGVKSTGRNVFAKIISLFRRPVDSVREIAYEGDMTTPMTFVIINIVAILVILFIAMSILKNEMGYYASEIISMKIVLYGAFFAAAYDFGLAGLLYACTKLIFKEETTFSEMLAVVGCKVILDTVILIVSLILMIMNPTFGLIVLSLGSIYTWIVFIMGYTEVSDLENNKKCYALFLATAAALIVMCVLYYVVIRSTMSGITGSLYNLL